MNVTRTTPRAPGLFVPTYGVEAQINLGPMVANVPQDYTFTDAGFIGADERPCLAMLHDTAGAAGNVYSFFAFISNGSTGEITVRVTCAQTLDPGDLFLFICVYPIQH